MAIKNNLYLDSISVYKDNHWILALLVFVFQTL
jgi:hypothetical protein